MNWKKRICWLMLLLIAPTSVVGNAPLLAADSPSAATTSVVRDENAPSDPAAARPFVVRLALVKMRWELLKQGQTKEAAAITTVLRNKDMLDAVAEAVCIRFAEEHPAGLPGSWVDQLVVLFEWLLENAPAIIELIIQIISLFAQGYTSLEVQNICHQAYGPQAAQLAAVIGSYLAV